MRARHRVGERPNEGAKPLPLERSAPVVNHHCQHLLMHIDSGPLHARFLISGLGE